MSAGPRTLSMVYDFMRGMYIPPAVANLYVIRRVVFRERPCPRWRLCTTVQAKRCTSRDVCVVTARTQAAYVVIFLVVAG